MSSMQNLLRTVSKFTNGSSIMWWKSYLIFFFPQTTPVCFCVFLDNFWYNKSKNLAEKKNPTPQNNKTKTQPTNQKIIKRANYL